MQGVRSVSDIAHENVNVNVNEFLFKRNNVNNVNVKSSNSKSIAKVEHIGWIADKLATEFHDFKSKNFYAKVAWALPENEIWKAFESAKRPCVQNPARYFTRICKIKLRKLDK